MRFSSFDELLRTNYPVSSEKTAFKIEKKGELVRVSGGDFLKAVDKRADELLHSGKTCEGIFCDGSYECVTEIFACVKAGLQVVLLNYDAVPEQITGTDVDTLWGDEDVYDEYGRYLTDGVEQGRGKILFFTSGTTAKTKAVVLSEESLCASAYNGGSLLPLNETDTLLCMLPLDHVFGFVCGLLWALSCGACVALGRGARHYIDDCSFYKPTAVSLVPLLAGFMLKKNLLNPELRLVLIGAGDCPIEIPFLFRKLGIRVSFGYGLTETSSGVALSLGGDPYAMTICPDDKITLAPDGEILVSCPSCMMRGYYKDEEATSQVLKNGVLYTGDLGNIDSDGLLHVVGRKKEIIVLKDGTKIFIPEYEKELSACMGGKDFAVIDKNGFPCLVVKAEDAEADDIKNSLKDFMLAQPLGKRLKELICVDFPLPRTATGKLKRWQIKQKVVKS